MCFHLTVSCKTEMLACYFFLLFVGHEVVVSEWELILNRAGISCGGVEAAKLIVCPKHRFKLTTLYTAKVA